MPDKTYSPISEAIYQKGYDLFINLGYSIDQLRRMEDYYLKGHSVSDILQYEKGFDDPLKKVQINGYMSIARSIEEKKQRAINEEKIRHQKEIEKQFAKYPNMPRDYGMEGVKHLDYMYSDPKGFWASAANAWNATDEAGKRGYEKWLHDLIVPVVDQNHYLGMFNALDLNHANFVIQHILPEHLAYLWYRWLAGPDARPAEWLKSRLDIIEQLVEEGRDDEAKAWKDDAIANIEEHHATLLDKVSPAMQGRALTILFPELLDDIDEANIDAEQSKETAKFIGLAVGGVVAVGGLLALTSRGKNGN